MSYDGAERLVSSVDPAGNATELGLDPLGNVLTATTQERNPQGGSVTVQQSATYDELNRPVTMTDPQGNTSQAIYDVRGNVKLSIDPEGNTTENTYDGLDRLLRTVQPEGISITYGYDASSRLTSYEDALGNETRWAYDALDRRLSTTYPDNTVVTYDYDDASNLVGWTDPRGTHVTQTFDLAGRLEARSVSAGAGVIGPFSESYELDGLGRLTRAQSGDVIVERDYDSLSRLLSETTNGKTITHGFDNAGNPTTIGYPSGHGVNQTFDPLDLPQTISASGPSSGTLATYGWRGTGLPVQKSLGNGLSGSAQFDLAGRLTSQAFTNPAGASVFQESLGWSPRNLKTSQSRGDLNGAGFLLAYDKAGRVTEAARSTAPVATPNNTTADPLAVAGLSNSFNFKYDAAQNLVERRTEKDKIFEAEPMPLDGSGRNRPASINGIQLEWDANGNLTRKGNFKFLYDYRNRLTRVTDLADNTFATYVYDAFNRRTSKTVGGDVRTVVWDGWQAVEEYKGGQLASRRTFGAGLDEIVRMENDLDGDGNLEQKYVPLYDDSGNLVTMTGVDGKPIERYVYSPYGEQTILVDSTAPAVEQVRTKGGALWLEISEEVSNSALTKALADETLVLTDLGTQEPLSIQVAPPVMTGRQARRRIAITTTGPPPVTGTQVKLTVPREALQDLFLNKPQQAYELTFAWPATDAVLFDDEPIRIDRVAILQGVIEIGLTEEPDSATAAGAIQIDGAATTWTLSEDRYTLRASSTLAAGSHTLSIGTTFADLDGNALAEAYANTFSAGNEATLALFEAPDARKTPVSTIGNPFSFQGHPRDLETGLVYVRNRYYDPELGRFITADPLGYVDGPNLYGFAMNDPVNGSDPMGTCYKGESWTECLKRGGKETLTVVRDFGGGVAQGIAGSVTWNLLPGAQAKDTDTKSQRVGQIVGSGITFYGGMQGTAAGLTATGVSCAATVPTLGGAAPVCVVSAGATALAASSVVGSAVYMKSLWNKGTSSGDSQGAKKPEDPAEKNGWKPKPERDLDWRGTGKTQKEAIEEAFDRTGVPKDQFKPTKWAKDAHGKSFPVEWRAKGGAEVSIDLGHAKNGPGVSHVGYQTPGKGGKVGHILLDDVSVNRTP